MLYIIRNPPIQIFSEPFAAFEAGNLALYIAKMEVFSDRAEAAAKSRQQIEGVKEYLYTHQTTGLIRYLLISLLRHVPDGKARERLFSSISDALPPGPPGGACVTGECGTPYQITFKPCFKTHDMGPWLEILPQAMRTKTKEVISFVLYVIREQYRSFMEEHIYIKDGLVKVLPPGKRDLELKVDPSNVTLYIIEEDLIREGVYIEPPFLMEQVNKEDNLAFILSSEPSLSEKLLAVDLLVTRGVVWSEFLVSVASIPPLSPLPAV